MRMRRKPNLEKRMNEVSALTIDAPEEYRGNWRQTFGGERLAIEIGCGKGRFICETAKQNPDMFFVAIERDRNVIVMAAERAQKMDLKNVRFVNIDAAHLNEFFENSEISRIYLNFSDPWRKSKQAKRRLTHKNFLAEYDKVLNDNGEIFFKTDNEKLFEFSLNEMSGYGLVLSGITFNLHSTDTPNVVTEYEERFSEQGMRIYRVEARKRK